MMINTSKFAFVTAVALIGIAPSAFAQPSTTHRHRYEHEYKYRSDAGAAPINPLDDPAMTGGGSEGYNECAGHPRC